MVWTDSGRAEGRCSSGNVCSEDTGRFFPLETIVYQLG
jgi:hypothetical protein